MIKRLKNKKGFTLAELLIVVAIIAVLVAISVPIFNSQLEKSREATDMANVRAAYAEVSAAVLDESTSSGDLTKTVTAVQHDTSKWTSGDTVNIGGQQVKAGKNWTITGNTSSGTVTITTNNN